MKAFISKYAKLGKIPENFEEGQRPMSIVTENLFPPTLALLRAYLMMNKKCLGKTVVS